MPNLLSKSPKALLTPQVLPYLLPKFPRGTSKCSWSRARGERERGSLNLLDNSIQIKSFHRLNAPMFPKAFSELGVRLMEQVKSLILSLSSFTILSQNSRDGNGYRERGTEP